MPQLGPGRVNRALYAFPDECEAKNGRFSGAPIDAGTSAYPG